MNPEETQWVARLELALSDFGPTDEEAWNRDGRSRVLTSGATIQD